MKFGYRDRIVLLIVVIVLILSIGIFAFIRPKVEEYNTNKAKRDSISSEWDAKLMEFSRINQRQDIIRKKYTDAKKVAAEFTPEMNSVEFGEFLQSKFINIEKFQQDEVKLLDQVDLSEKGTSSLSYYYYTPSIVTYPLYEYADLDGSLAAAAEEKMSESNLLGSRASQTVGSSSAKLTLEINREDTMELLNAINDYAKKNNDTMLVESVSLENCDFNEDYVQDGETAAPVQQEEPELDEEGNPIEQTVTNEKDEKIPDGVKPGYTKVTISYRVFYVQEPTEPDVGDPYDETIWDGNEWKSVGVSAESTAE